MSTDSSPRLLRSLPQVEVVMQVACMKELLAHLPRNLIVEAVRTTIEALRSAILANTFQEDAIDAKLVAQQAYSRALCLKQPSLRRVVNASGVIIHTNLGRSALAPEAVCAVEEVTRGYSTLEYDTATQARGSRHNHCEQIICALTGAEAALAVNNNAAAVMMVLSEFSAGRETIVSRGELVEIGGSFRVPDIMALSQAAMVEVGTTNKTHIADYACAITERTSLLLKVHPSNYRMIGFTESVDVGALKELAVNETNRRGALSPTDKDKVDDVLVFEDQGSGVLLDLGCFGEYCEPTVGDSLRAGCDIVSFSGDKLLGGPQAGIIVGDKRYIDRLKSNPLARALRLDKMTLAALEATLRLYLNEERAKIEIPTLRMLTESSEKVRTRAEQLLKALKAALPSECVELSIVEEISRAGGGALPMCDIPTFAVRIVFLENNAQHCERYLIAKHEPPIVARIKKETLLFDARTLLNTAEIDEIAQALTLYFEEG